MKIIRDSLHGYIRISELEVGLISQPSILRLHRVLQNSTLYQTYPSNRGSRFIHSIGAMYLSSMMFKAMIRNSRREYVTRIHRAVWSYIKQIDHFDFLESCRSYLDNLERIDEDLKVGRWKSEDGQPDAFYMTEGWSIVNERNKITLASSPENYPNLINNILFQSLRLAALVHDVGHLPYSHIIENALQDKVLLDLAEGKTDALLVAKSRKLETSYRDLLSNSFPSLLESDVHVKLKLHEALGIILIQELIGKLIAGRSENQQYFFRLCLIICKRILALEQLGHFERKPFLIALDKVENHNYLDLYPLANIISGPVDCDRVDYLQRDTLNSGAHDLNSFDHGRIVDNIVVLQPPETRHLPPEMANKLIVPGFDRKSLSAIADFFYSRLRQQRWMLNHHNVVRTDLALVRLIHNLVYIYEQKLDKTIVDILRKNNFEDLFAWEDLVNCFEKIDDSWLETLLNRVYQDLKMRNDSELTGILIQSKIFLKVFFERDTKKMIPLWKREDEFILFAEEFHRAIKDKGLIPEQNGQLQHDQIVGFKQFLKDIQDESDHIFATNRILEHWSTAVELDPFNAFSPFTVMKQFEYQFLQAADNLKLFFVLKTYSPYDNVPIILKNKEVRYLEQLSPLVKLIEPIFSRNLMLYAFSIEKPKTTTSEFIKDIGYRLGNMIYHSF